MVLKDFYEDKKLVLARLPFIQYSAIAVFVFLFLGIWNLQILKSKYYREQAEKNQVQASRFVLMDSSGCTRATLELDCGEPVLRMVGSSGTTQVQLGITEAHQDSASLYLQNSTRSSFASLAASDIVGSSTIEFGGNLKRVRVATNLPGSDPTVRLTDESDKETYHVP